ncbi:MAG: BCD family MFS transporter [Pseudomonadota bacterium]
MLRLGLVQMSLGSVVVLTTATMNRVMVVELALPAVVPGLLVALYYATQFLRPRFGHGADQGRRRTPWILGGVATLGLGGTAAALSVWLMAWNAALGIAAAVPAFLLIGLGIGAAGTNLLALLAATVAPDRRAAAGSAVWMMMIAGLAVTGISVGQLLDPYTPQRLVLIAAAVALVAVALSGLALIGIEAHATQRANQRAAPERPRSTASFRTALAEVWADRRARIFALFVFAAMFAYNAQDLILEPFAGHVFAMTPGESTALGGQMHAGALTGMLAVLVSSTALRRFVTVSTRVWIVGGCAASGACLVALGLGAQTAPAWPLTLNVALLGFFNGAFAVAAIGAMMSLAAEGGPDGDGGQEGLRMGVFGAAQAIAFGLGSLSGTIAVDLARRVFASDATAYGSVFAAEGVLFLISALMALRIAAPRGPNPTQEHAHGL